MTIEVGPIESTVKLWRPWEPESKDTITEHVQRANVDGVEYKRDGRLYSSYPIQDYNDITHRHYRICVESNDAPNIRCGDCLGAAFELYYGLYEISARCVGCGKEDVVYDE